MEMRWSVKLAESIVDNGLSDKFQFSDALLARAFLTVYRNTNEEKIRNAVERYVKKFMDEDGNFNPEKENISDYKYIAAGILFIDMYRLTRNGKFKKASYSLWNNIRNCKRTAEGVFCVESEGDYVGSDALYYISEFMAGHISAFKYEKRFGGLVRQFMVAYNNLKDKKTGVLHNFYDRNKVLQWADRKTGFSPCIYTPITARFIVALVDFIFCLDYSEADTKILINLFRETIDTLVKYRSEKGCFYVVLDEGGREGNYFECRSSVMILYAIAKGLNKNILFNYELYEIADELYNGIIDEFVTISPKGKINVNKTCAQCVYSDDLSYSYYMGLNVVSNDKETIAMFILAMNEYEKLKGIDRKN